MKTNSKNKGNIDMLAKESIKFNLNIDDENFDIDKQLLILDKLANAVKKDSMDLKIAAINKVNAKIVEIYPEIYKKIKELSDNNQLFIKSGLSKKFYDIERSLSLTNGCYVQINQGWLEVSCSLTNDRDTFKELDNTQRHTTNVMLFSMFSGELRPFQELDYPKITLAREQAKAKKALALKAKFEKAKSECNSYFIKEFYQELNR